MQKILLAVTLLLPVAAFAAEGAMTGPATWTWNAKESKVAGEAPKSAVLKITKDDGTNVAWSMTSVDQKGKTQKMSWAGAYDGKERAVKGGGKLAMSKDGDTVKIAAREKDGSAVDESCAVSSDKKKMTCRGTMKGKDGKSTDYTDVYDRS